MLGHVSALHARDGLANLNLHCVALLVHHLQVGLIGHVTAQHPLHVVFTAGLHDWLARGGGDVLAVLLIDILGYLVRLLFTSLLWLINTNLTCDIVLGTGRQTSTSVLVRTFLLTTVAVSLGTW